MRTRHTPTISRYIKMVQAYPQLDREEELALARAWCERGDRAAADKLVRAHLRHVVAVAVKYRWYGVPLAELIAEGNFAVVCALKKFQPERGNRFLTYAAHWIRAYITSYVIRSWSVVRTQSGPMCSKLFFRLRRERSRLQNLHGDCEIVDDLLARQLCLPREKIKVMVQRLESHDVSLDAKAFLDSKTTVVDTLIASGEDQEELLESDGRAIRLREAVREALAELDVRERLIVEKRVMADRESELSLIELGQLLGLSHERVRQLEMRAKQKLKGSLERLSHANGSDE